MIYIVFIFYSSIGFHDFGFVSLMKINEWSNANFVDFNDIPLEGSANVLKVKHYCYKDDLCRCSNFLYSDPKGGINKIYTRYLCDNTLSDSTLVYDIDVLKNGFSGSIIL